SFAATQRLLESSSALLHAPKRGRAGISRRGPNHTERTTPVYTLCRGRQAGYGEGAAQPRGSAVKPSTRSLQAAAPSNSASRSGPATSWTARGSPVVAIPLGRETAGAPMKLHGAQNRGSPVEASPGGAGAGATGVRRIA